MIDYKYELSTLRQYIYEQQERFDIMLKGFRDVCQHSNVETTKVNHRVGYDYSASSTYTFICKDCGVSTSVKIDHNSGFE